MAENLDILREKLQQLHEDYHSLKNHFDMMSEGYQESLLLYDKLMETNQELEETNKQLDIARRLGGDIVLDTTYTNGARFVFSLPK